MIRGWKSSSWTKGRDRAFDELTAVGPSVRTAGRHATAEPPTRPDPAGPTGAAGATGATGAEGPTAGSFYVRPHDVPQLSSFPDGVGPELRRHLEAQGLTTLAGQVDGWVRLGRSLAGRDRADDTVGDLVYEMH